MKFKGTAPHQVKTIFEQSGMLQFGQSRHVAKQAAKTNGARDPNDYAYYTAIYSHATHRAYFKTCTELLRYATTVHGIKKANQLTSEHIRDFLLSKSGVKLATFRRYSAALTKFDAALSRLLDRPPRWRDTLKQFREAAPVALESEQPARAYRNPAALVGQIDAGMKLVAELQWKGGLRVMEACRIRPEQLKGITTDNEGRSFGLLEIRGKGGKVRTVSVTTELYDNLQKRMGNGILTINPAQYRERLRQAAHQSGQQYTEHGTHGLRWCYAQERMEELIRGGIAYEVALTQVSKLMGHERASITCRYLRRG
jgi:integrase